MRGSLESYFLFMGLQPLKPCLVILAANGWSRHSARPPVPCLLTLTANEWSRRSDRSPVPGSLTLTAPTKHLYHAYNGSFRRLRCLQHVILTVYAVSCRAKPEKAGGVGVQPPH